MRCSPLLVLGLLLLLSPSLTAAQASAPPPPPPGAPSTAVAFDAKSYREAQRLASRRKHAEVRTDRPSYYVRRRTLGFIAVGAGAVCVGWGLANLLIRASTSLLPDGDDDKEPLTTRERRTIGIPIAVGLPVLGIGIWAVRSPVLEARAMRKLSVLPELRPGRVAHFGVSVQLRM